MRETKFWIASILIYIDRKILARVCRYIVFNCLQRKILFLSYLTQLISSYLCTFVFVFRLENNKFYEGAFTPSKSVIKNFFQSFWRKLYQSCLFTWSKWRNLNLSIGQGNFKQLLFIFLFTFQKLILISQIVLKSIKVNEKISMEFFSIRDKHVKIPSKFLIQVYNIKKLCQSFWHRFKMLKNSVKVFTVLHQNLCQNFLP